MINLWIAFASTATAAIQSAADSEATDDLSRMVQHQRGSVDANTTSVLFARPTIDGLEWTLYSVYMDDAEVEPWANAMPLIFPGLFRVLGAWDYSTGVAVREQASDLVSFMPGGELTQVNLLAGQADRQFGAGNA